MYVKLKKVLFNLLNFQRLLADMTKEYLNKQAFETKSFH